MDYARELLGMSATKTPLQLAQENELWGDILGECLRRMLNLLLTDSDTKH